MGQDTSLGLGEEQWARNPRSRPLNLERLAESQSHLRVAHRRILDASQAVTMIWRAIDDGSNNIEGIKRKDKMEGERVNTTKRI
jgi:hypothetical protein